MHPILPYAREGGAIGVGHDSKPSSLVLHMISFVGGTVCPRVNAKSMELAFHELRKAHYKCKRGYSYLAFVGVPILVKVFPITSLLPINPAPLEEIGGIF